MKQPTKQEIKEEMEAYNADEVGLNNPITLEEAEYNLLNSDKYYYQNLGKKCPKCGRNLVGSDLPDYKFQCFDCDEDFYTFEAN